MGRCGWCGTSKVINCVYSDGRQTHEIPCWHCDGTGTDKNESVGEKLLTKLENSGVDCSRIESFLIRKP